MSEADLLYQNAIDAMTPREKVARSVALFNWSREFIGRQIKEANPNASPERLKLLVALRMYQSDNDCKRLIEELLENVPD